jgi:hypothetical protein
VIKLARTNAVLQGFTISGGSCAYVCTTPTNGLSDLGGNPRIANNAVDMGA